MTESSRESDHKESPLLDLNQLLLPGRRARWVLLHHTQISESLEPSLARTHQDHFDLMVETSLGSLWTWAIDRVPNSVPQLAQRLTPHRAAYLDYEGPVSRNRGTVQRLLSGQVESASSLGVQQVSDCARCHVWRIELGIDQSRLNEFRSQEAWTLTLAYCGSCASTELNQTRGNLEHDPFMVQVPPLIGIPASAAAKEYASSPGGVEQEQWWLGLDQRR